MDCSQCGSLVQEGQEICPACGGRVRKRSFLQRIWRFFCPARVSETKVFRTSKVELKNIAFIDKETGKPQTLEEIPPELRATFEEAIASGQGRRLGLDEISPELRKMIEEAIASGHGVTKQVVSYQGPEGLKHTYHSLEEMPSDIRAKLQEARASDQAVIKEVYSFQGPDGQQHTYHSLEEMPPGIRAIYQEWLPANLRVPRRNKP